MNIKEHQIWLRDMLVLQSDYLEEIRQKVDIDSHIGPQWYKQELKDRRTHLIDLHNEH